jgi:hypothetical protein
VRAPLHNLGTTQGEMSKKRRNHGVTTSLLQWEKHVGGQIWEDVTSKAPVGERAENTRFRRNARRVGAFGGFQ